ncbi:uncharacterized protein SPSK_10651 [Sporothrix schenckii 1099-18]|uniref:Uncharacterized protein n=1 Tax=Sporothrix schenckii 1099-18 TaxID=1397361 RepID=A0A0F2LWL3_SPOSC|nr:uncharacterized protein SPSK_10651 [Sporothrix schenckii 1099-18]KJR80885.1 hypothetical protein SPSK_10651 [Sporothrix schenckii 1099-18]
MERKTTRKEAQENANESSGKEGGDDERCVDGRRREKREELETNGEKKEKGRKSRKKYGQDGRKRVQERTPGQNGPQVWRTKSSSKNGRGLAADLSSALATPGGAGAVACACLVASLRGCPCNTPSCVASSLRQWGCTCCFWLVLASSPLWNYGAVGLEFGVRHWVYGAGAMGGFRFGACWDHWSRDFSSKTRLELSLKITWRAKPNC